MNERIRKLAEQAKIEFTYDPTETPMREFVEAWGGDLEKFAELIVRECIEVTKNYTCTSTWDYSAPVALARHFEIGPNYIVYPEIGVEE
jgi:hypothetical protein